MIEPPFPALDDLMDLMGVVGRRLSEIEATEGAAGNISLCLRWQFDPRTRFPLVKEFHLPQSVPELAGATFLVTGSGRRLREIGDDPVNNLACVVVDEGGQKAKLYTSYHPLFERVTSEFNSHLAVHYDQVVTTSTNFHAVIHAQPIHLTFLSHIPRYQDEAYLNTHLMRWEPETIINLPEGIGMVPFQIPGSQELMNGTLVQLRHHRIVIWAKHGVMARSDISLKRASDRIEYAETAARYEYLNLAVGEIGTGLSKEEILGICKKFGVQQSIF